jgi:hypothetical protein
VVAYLPSQVRVAEWRVRAAEAVAQRAPVPALALARAEVRRVPARVLGPASAVAEPVPATSRRAAVVPRVVREAAVAKSSEAAATRVVEVV